MADQLCFSDNNCKFLAVFYTHFMEEKNDQSAV